MKFLKNYFIPNADNGYRPGIFSKNSVIAIAAVLVFVQVAWFAGTTFISRNPNFLAAILPGVILALTNNDRATNDLSAVTENPLLDAAAQLHANDMAAKGYFAHVSPDGKQPWYWLDQVGYNYTYAGENLAVDFTDSTAVNTAWMNSPEHRANILKPEYTQMGIALANGTYQGQQVTFVVTFFGTPAPAGTPVNTAPIEVSNVPKTPTELATVTRVAARPTVAIASPTTTPTSTAGVLAASVAPSAAKTPPPPTPTFWGRIASEAKIALTSPDRTMIYFLVIFTAIIALLLFLSIFVKVGIQYLEVIGGGVLLMAIAGGSIFFLEAHMQSGQLPAGGQAASVYVGAQGD